MKSRDAQLFPVPQFLHAVDEGEFKTPIGTPPVKPPPHGREGNFRFAGHRIILDGKFIPLTTGVQLVQDVVENLPERNLRLGSTCRHGEKRQKILIEFRLRNFCRHMKIRRMMTLGFRHMEEKNQLSSL